MRKEHAQLPKVIAIVGPTAAGKTLWSLKLAKAFEGEIISADSRQVYKKMDIGTAKPEGEWRRNGLRRTFFVEDIPHHLIDFLDPGKTFTAAEFRDKVNKYVKLAGRYKRFPIIVGGTGLYVQAFVDNLKIPRVPPHKKFRESLDQKSAEELFALYETLDPVGAEKIDRKNKRRLIRALEVTIMGGEPFSKAQGKGEKLYDVLQIGVLVPREELHERINRRVDGMMANGLLDEVVGLLKQKYSWDLPSMSGIGYRQFRDYLVGEITLEQSVEHLKRDTRRFARRQMTWFRRDKRIQWCDTYEQAEKKVGDFLKD